MKTGAAAAKTAVWAAERFNPITNSQSAPLKTQALFDSFGPSLMPRASLHQGMAAGLSILAADLVVYDLFYSVQLLRRNRLVVRKIEAQTIRRNE